MKDRICSFPWCCQFGGMKDGESSNSPLGRRFHRFLTRLVQHARNDLHHLPLQQNRRIHLLRVRMKKLRAILRLVKARMPELEYRSIQSSARKLKQTFDRQRDARVAAELSARFGVPSSAKKRT